MKTLTFFLLLCLPVNMNAQDENFNFNDPVNIKMFADDLFCNKDYLRAVFEYERILTPANEDSLRFKIGLCYSIIGKFDEAISNFLIVKHNSSFYGNSKFEILRTNFLMRNFTGLKNFYNNTFSKEVTVHKEDGTKLLNFSYLFTEEPLPEADDFISPFEINERKKIINFYNWKKDPPNKSGTLAGIMSAVIPGSGKIYIGEVSDGIVALIVTGVFSFLAYDNFQANHNARAWIFTGLAGLFYGGNVYGSVTAAQIHNEKIKFEYEESVRKYLEKNNYYSPEYGFCDENN